MIAGVKVRSEQDINHSSGAKTLHSIFDWR